jgi:hypothetical protein
MMRALTIVLLLAVVFVTARAEAQVQFNLFLTGQAETDGAGNFGLGDPDGTAQGTLTLFADPNFGYVEWNFAYSNISGAAISGFHIHGPATPSQNAGIVVALEPLSSTAVPDGTQVGLVYVFDRPGLATQIDNILANPAMYYVNLHSSGAGGFPGGAVRGQLPEPGVLSLLVLGTMGLLRRARGR